MVPALRSLFSIVASHFFHRHCCYWALLLVSLSACNSSTTKEKEAARTPAPGEPVHIPTPAPLPAAEVLRLHDACQAWYDTVLKAKNFNGGMIVAKNGNIVFEAYNGTGHQPGTDVITDTTSMHIASVSKTFTAMAVLKLAQEGKLNIDDEFSKFFPQFNYPGVTVRTLLNHRSGLPNYTHFLERMNWDKKQVASNQDVLDFLINRKAEMENIGTPGVHFSYCNSNYALLALLIEKISGLSYPDFMQQQIFTPLGMKHTFVFRMADTARVPPSYDWRGTLMDFNFLDAVYGDKNIYTTPRDLLTWDRALSSTPMFSAETLAQAYAPYSNEKPGMKNYGLGWRMYLFPTGKKIIYHNGWWHGSNANFTRLVQDSATIILIGNRFTRSIYHARVLANLFGDYYIQQEEEDTENQKTFNDGSTTTSAIVSGNEKAKKKFADRNSLVTPVKKSKAPSKPKVKSKK